MKISSLPLELAELARRRRKECMGADPTSNDIMYAIHWSFTPEGADFWCEVYRARTKKELPQDWEQQVKGAKKNSMKLPNGDILLLHDRKWTVRVRGGRVMVSKHGYKTQWPVQKNGKLFVNFPIPKYVTQYVNEAFVWIQKNLTN